MLIFLSTSEYLLHKNYATEFLCVEQKKRSNDLEPLILWNVLSRQCDNLLVTCICILSISLFLSNVTIFLTDANELSERSSEKFYKIIRKVLVKMYFLSKVVHLQPKTT